MGNRFQQDQDQEPQEEKSMILSHEEHQRRIAEQADYRYNPEHALHKVGYAQEKMLDAVLTMDMTELLYKPKIMENVNTLLSNMNGTAVQVTRNSIVESNSNLGALADSVIDQMQARGLQLIKKSKDVGQRGHIPQTTDIVIEEADFEEIQQGMLIKGLVNKTFDEFADEHDIHTQENDF